MKWASSEMSKNSPAKKKTTVDISYTSIAGERD